MNAPCLSTSKCLLIACDDFVIRNLRDQFAPYKICWHHANNFPAAEKESYTRRFEAVMIEIGFDEARIFDLLKLVRKGPNAETPIVCFRGTAPMLGLYCNDVIATAVGVLANARFVDLSFSGTRVLDFSHLLGVPLERDSR